jgi:TetR/AcrR family transcriptional repressor of nem operon
MPRLKEFDEQAVLWDAMELFRARGYERTSFCDLTRELGVARQSLYDTYGDKEALFAAALDRYCQRSLIFTRACLSGQRELRAELREFLLGTIHAACTEDFAGCLVVNSLIERVADNSATHARLLAHARETEGLLASRFSAAQRAGELSAEHDPVELARFFYHSLFGFAVGARAFRDQAGLEANAKLALRVLG